MGTKPRINAKDLVIYWMRKYQQKVGKKYFVSWMADGAVFKRLLSTYKPNVIKSVIDKAFSGCDAAHWLGQTGFSLRIFPKVFNQLLNATERPWSSLDKIDLDLPTHYSVDYRVEFIWSCIRDGDIHSLICHITDEYYFHLLMAKMEAQDGSIPEKVLIYYETWKDKNPPERSSICHERESRHS